jgi:hypothetical protein
MNRKLATGLYLYDGCTVVMTGANLGGLLLGYLTFRDAMAFGSTGRPEWKGPPQLLAVVVQC